MDFFFLVYFQFIILVFSLFTVIVRNPVYSIFYLILVFLNSSCLILLLGLEFLALLFLIVYLGAIVVLFIFVIMMVNVKILEINIKIWSQLYTVIFILSVFLMIFSTTFLYFEFYVTHENLYLLADWSTVFFVHLNVRVLGFFLFTYFSYSFILLALILLLAMVGAITMVIHPLLLSKKQYLYRQVNRSVLNSIIFVNSLKKT